MGQCKLASKVGGGNKDTKNYLFKNGAWQGGIATTSFVGCTYNNGIVMNKGVLGYFSVPYVKSSEVVYAKINMTNPNNSIALNTTSSTTSASDNNGVYMGVVGGKTGIYVLGSETKNVISMVNGPSASLSSGMTITEIWTETVA